MAHEAPADMVALAAAMLSRAYAPYSNFAVGAVLRGANGRLYGGCNVENAAYPQGCCAETSAISAMVGDGERRIAEVLVMGQGVAPVSPCGGCRQRLREFAGADVTVHLCNASGKSRAFTMGELLPYSFGPVQLTAKR
jgi:cytidine deaminase